MSSFLASHSPIAFYDCNLFFLLTHHVISLTVLAALYPFPDRFDQGWEMGLCLVRPRKSDDVQSFEQ